MYWIKLNFEVNSQTIVMTTPPLPIILQHELWYNLGEKLYDDKSA